MKKRHHIRIVVLIILVLSMLAFTSCKKTDKSDIEGAYYLYENNSYNKSDYIILEKNTWKDDDNENGTYTLSGKQIIFYMDLFGSKEELYSGSISDGVMELEILGATMFYCKEGKTPSSSEEDKPNPTTKEEYKIIYDANGGSFAQNKLIYETKATKDSLLIAPESPTKDDYNFAGWAKDKSGKEKWSFASDKVKGNLTLYAIWTKNIVEYDVTFDLNYDRMPQEIKSTENGGYITYTPVREGFVFVGWYRDKECTLEYDIKEKVTKPDLILYAEWIKEPEQEGQLYTPIVSLKENVFTWNAVANAKGYRIQVLYQGGTDVLLDEKINNLTWTFPNDLDPEIYIVKICALGDGIHTINSGFNSKYYKHKVLDAPKNLIFNKTNSMMSWDPVDKAEEYEIYLNNKLISTIQETEFDLSQYDAGNYTVTISSKKQNWKKSSTNLEITKIRLAIPKVSISVDPKTKEYILSWSSVNHANEYKITLNNQEEKTIKDTKYLISNNSSYFKNGILKVNVQAYDNTTTYLISSATEHELKRIYDLNIGSNIEEAGSVLAEGNIWGPVIVTFDMNDKTMPSKQQIITTTNGIQYEVPTRNGYIFTGWYVEKECKNIYDFTEKIENSFTLYAGWETTPTNYLEINSGKISYSSTSSERRTYFRTLADGLIKISYNQTSSGNTSYIKVYDATAKEINIEEMTFKNTTPNTLYVYPKQGHVYYVSTHSSANTTIELAISTYQSNTYLPSDGGTAIQDYCIQNISSNNNNIVCFEEEITLSAIKKPFVGYTFLGWYDGETLISKEYTYTFTMPSKNVNYIAKFKIDEALNNLTYTYTETTCEITGVKDTNVTSIVIPEYVTSIGSSAFYECSSLTSIVIPNSVTSIGESAFHYCYKLVEIYNLSSLNITKGSSSNGYVGYYAKIIHTSLEEESNLIEKDDYVFYKDNENKYYLISYKGTDTELVLPNNIKGNTYEIYQYAFMNCSSLTSIVIPNSVTSIGESAFHYCYKLVEIYNLSSLNITKGSSSNGYVGYYAKIIHTSLEEESNLIEKDDYVFYKDNENKYYLITYKGIDTELVLPTDIEGNNYEINQSAFWNCSNLISIVIPNSVTSIGYHAFSDCSSLTSVTIGNNVTDIVAYAFMNCSNLTSIVIPDSVSIIGFAAFSQCSSLTSVTIGNSVTRIEEFAFNFCSNLTNIIIPDNVTYIEDGAFNGCYRLVEIYNLSSLNITKGSSSNGYVGYYAKIIHTSLEEESNLIEKDDYVFYKDNENKYYLITYKGIDTELVLPTDIEGNNYEINQSAFWNCSNLISIVIPDSVTSIGKFAFAACGKLTNIYYKGTSADWNKITIGSSNNNLTSATRYYYSETKPTTSGNYWHYLDGVPTIWK